MSLVGKSHTWVWLSKTWETLCDPQTGIKMNSPYIKFSKVNVVTVLRFTQMELLLLLWGVLYHIWYNTPHSSRSNSIWVNLSTVLHALQIAWWINILCSIWLGRFRLCPLMWQNAVYAFREAFIQENKKNYGKFHNQSDPPSPPFLAKIIENFEKY